jgi:hypothetical protein
MNGNREGRRRGKIEQRGVGGGFIREVASWTWTCYDTG